MERIDKILARQGIASRREVKELIKQGRVTAGGAVVTDCAFKIDEDNCAVTVDGKTVAVKKYIYIMMNKPKGVVSASAGEDKTVVDLVPAELFRKGLFPAGRLDKDTTGFVLITDDGDFAHKILSPKNHVYKTYLARLQRPVPENEMKKLENGITLLDGTSLKGAKVETVEEGEQPLVKIMICEGKYHQVKRMFAAAGSRVLELHRQKIGGLSLDAELSVGECREITPEELKKITWPVFSDFDNKN